MGSCFTTLDTKMLFTRVDPCFTFDANVLFKRARTSSQISSTMRLSLFEDRAAVEFSFARCSRRRFFLDCLIFCKHFRHILYRSPFFFESNADNSSFLSQFEQARRPSDSVSFARCSRNRCDFLLPSPNNFDTLC